MGKRNYISQKCTGRVLIQLVQGRHFETTAVGLSEVSLLGPLICCVSLGKYLSLSGLLSPPQREKPAFSLNR